MAFEEYMTTKERNEKGKTEALNRYNKKKFVTYNEAKDIYSLGQTSLEKMIVDAGAKYKIGKKVLINMEKFDMYLESYRVMG